MPRDHDYYVYMVTNFTRTVLYIGVTSDLEGRLFEHRIGTCKGFTKQYNVDRLVFCEHYGHIVDAIAREKQLKGWTRAKKEALIATENPRWDDLSSRWLRQPLGP